MFYNKMRLQSCAKECIVWISARAFKRIFSSEIRLRYSLSKEPCEVCAQRTPPSQMAPVPRCSGCPSGRRARTSSSSRRRWGSASRSPPPLRCASIPTILFSRNSVNSRQFSTKRRKKHFRTFKNCFFHTLVRKKKYSVRRSTSSRPSRSIGIRTQRWSVCSTRASSFLFLDFLDRY